VGNLLPAATSPRRGVSNRVLMAVWLAVVFLVSIGVFLHWPMTSIPEIARESGPETEVSPGPPAIVARDSAPAPRGEGSVARTDLPVPVGDARPIDPALAVPARSASTETEVARSIPTEVDTARPARPGPIEIPLTDRVRDFRYPRSASEIRSTLGRILEEPTAPGVVEEAAAALRRLKAYRYLAGIPYRHLTLDEHLGELATAAAGICRRLGHLSHTPDNPGWPAEQYERARLGAKNANLAFGALNLAAAVDMWMGDSDEMNLDRLGHRRWCLNPAMRKTGMGRVGEYAAMWVTDADETTFEDFNFIGYPSPGFMPIDFFDARHAWSLTLNPRDFRPPRPDRVQVRIYRVEGRVVDSDHPLELDHFTVENSRFGLPNCLIFRPRSLEIEDGRRYWIEVKRLERAEGAPARLGYLVEFIN
jgi:uncharacterized protein YkwD